MTLRKDSYQRPVGPRGPKPELIRIQMDWKDAVKKSLARQKPVRGWPK
jgi:hypothetical protein